MGFKLSVIEVLCGPLHVIFMLEFNDTRTVAEHVRVYHLSRLTHVIFHILPTAARWQVRHHQSVVGTPRWSAPRAASSTRETAARVSESSGTSGTFRDGVLHAELLSRETVTVTATNRVCGVAGVLVLDETERHSVVAAAVPAATVTGEFEIEFRDAAILLEQVLHIMVAHIAG